MLADTHLNIIKMKNVNMILICVMLLLCGCHTIQYVPVEKTKIEYITKTDTCIIQDSVFVKQWQSADTVYVDKYKYKYINTISKDTVLKIDTIPVIQEVQVPVRYIPAYYKKINIIFWCLIVLIIAIVAVKLYFRR